MVPATTVRHPDPVEGHPSGEHAHGRAGVEPLVAAPASTAFLSNTSATFGPIILEVVINTAVTLTAAASMPLEIPIPKEQRGALQMLVQNSIAGAQGTNIGGPPWLFCGVAIPPNPSPPALGPLTNSIKAAVTANIAGGLNGTAGVGAVGIKTCTVTSNASSPSLFNFNIVFAAQANATLNPGTRIIIVSIGGV
jgi:hypothetical protein